MISDLLKSDIEAYASRVLGSSELFTLARRGELTPAAMAIYIENLRVLVQRTESNLRLAQERAEELGKTKLAAHFAHKRLEEAGHERWAEDDLSNLRGMFAVSPSTQLTGSIASLLAYLREVILEEPVRYLAYMLLAEYVTVLIGPELLMLLEERCGIPVSSMSVISHHVDLDKDHAVEGLREIDTLANDERYLVPMRQTMQESMA